MTGHDSHVIWLRSQYAMTTEQAEREALRRYDEYPKERQRWGVCSYDDCTGERDVEVAGAELGMLSGEEFTFVCEKHANALRADLSDILSDEEIEQVVAPSIRAH